MLKPEGLPIRRAIDWGKLAPLRLQARAVADGVYAGGHRSPRRGSGIEFGGHRNYVPGDDLRWLDRHAVMRHGRLMIREFETETDRALRLIVDASLSMAYRSPKAPGAKLAYAAVVAAALARIALAAGDPVALDWLGGVDRTPLSSMGGRDAFERVVGALETVSAGGDLRNDLMSVERALAPVARHAQRGSVIVLLTDLIDLPPETLNRFGALASRGRTLLVVQVLDPFEQDFPFDGPVRLRSSEGRQVVETDGPAVRERYLQTLKTTRDTWEQALSARGGRLILASTMDDPIAIVRSVVVAERPQS